jgi:hypothetical protein
MQHEHQDTQAREENSRPHIRYVWVFWGFLAIALAFLLLEHRAHLYGALPYLLLLACPLMHLFMHHGHGGQDSRKPSRHGEPPRED